MFSMRVSIIAPLLPLILAATFCSLGHGQEPGMNLPFSSAPKVDDGAPNVRHPPDLTSSFKPLYLPEAIDTEERERYSAVMNLSEAQCAFFETIHENYLKEERALRERELPQLWELSMRVARWGTTWESGPNAIADHEQFVQHRDRYDRAMRSMEDRLFGQLADVLAQEQMGGFHRVKAMRERVRDAEVLISFPAAQADLSRMVFDQRLNKSLEPLNPDIDEVLSAYETTLTQLRRAHARAFWDSYKKTPAILAAGDFAQHLRLMNRYHRYERQLTDLNILYAETLATLMQDDPEGEYLLRMFREAAFWGIFPDPNDVRTLLSIAADEAPEELQGDVRSIADSYQMRQDMISREMVHVQLQEERRIQATSRIGGEREEEYRARLDALQMERAKIAESAIAGVTSLFEGELPNRLSIAITSYRESIEADTDDPRVGLVYRPGAVSVNEADSND